MQEWIDVYTIDREPTGLTIDRKHDKLNPDQYMLYALALMENENGQFLFTRRSMDKKWAPGAWEIPGGGVDSGETTETAVKREALEETGISIEHAEITLALTYRNDEPESGDNYFCDIYRCKLPFSESDVHIQEEEISGFRLLTYDELLELKEHHDVMHLNHILDAIRQK